MSKRKFIVKYRFYRSQLLIVILACLLLIAGVVPVLEADSHSDIQNIIEKKYFASLKDYSILSSGNEVWNKTFGASNIDVGYCVQQTADGGYIISGYTRSYGASGHNIWLIKTDNNGNELWNTTFGGSGDDEGEAVQQTSDGGYIITGWTKSYGSGMKDLWLIKTDSTGVEQWNKLFGGTNDDGGTYVVQTSDGGYIVSGYTSSFGSGSVDGWLIKTDVSGNQQWTKTLGGLSSDGAWCVQQTSDYGYILTGWTYSSGPGYVGNVWLVKTDGSGNQQWSKAYGGDDVDRGLHVQQTTDDGYIITGYTASYGAGLDDMLLIKTDLTGTEEWMKTFGGTGRDYGNCVDQTNDGGYIIAGYTLSFGAGGDDVWLVKTNSLGEKQWDETYGGTSSDVAYFVQQTTDTGYIVTGHTLSYGAGVHDVWLIKIKGNGTLPLVVDAGGPYNGWAGESVAFTGTVTGGVPPYEYLWEFGDNTTSTEQSPTHMYTAAGIYTATFSVVDINDSEAHDTATVTILMGDTTPPEVTITAPLAKSLYLRNKRVLPFPVTLILGNIDITVDAFDNDSDIANVTFSLNGVSKNTDTAAPFTWAWNEKGFGRNVITVEAYDRAGNHATDEIIVWRIF